MTGDWIANPTAWGAPGMPPIRTPPTNLRSTAIEAQARRKAEGVELPRTIPGTFDTRGRDLSVRKSKMERFKNLFSLKPTLKPKRRL